MLSQRRRQGKASPKTTLSHRYSAKVKSRSAITNKSNQKRGVNRATFAQLRFSDESCQGLFSVLSSDIAHGGHIGFISPTEGGGAGSVFCSQCRSSGRARARRRRRVSTISGTGRNIPNTHVSRPRETRPGALRTKHSLHKYENRPFSRCLLLSLHAAEEATGTASSSSQ